MIKLLKSTIFKFTQTKFYHPTTFKYDPQYHQKHNHKLQYFINIYRKYAHHYSKIDPLELYQNNSQFVNPLDLGINYQINLNQIDPQYSYLSNISNNLKQLQINLKKVYQTSVGVQFDHIQSLQEQAWLYYNYQKIMMQELSIQKKKKFAKLLVQAEAFEHFLHKKFNTFKRYSGQGGQSSIIAFKQIIQNSAQNKISEIVVGMSHRGRFNILTNLLDYPVKNLLRKISGKTDTPSELINVVDDVTSHISNSISKTIQTSRGAQNIKISVVHNPSHLQTQNSVSMGKTRSKQNISKSNVLNLQFHGDAAFSAQGIVYQSLCLSCVPNFEVKGTIHIIINNQIGYTTKPIDSRPSKYCSEISKAFNIPILHVNSQNIESVRNVVKLACSYRQKYKKDILIDLVCYRRYGHNQMDEPQFTQPIMYNKIRKDKITFPKQFMQKLQKDNLIEQNYYNLYRTQLFDKWEIQFQNRFNTNPSVNQYKKQNGCGSTAFTQQWKNFVPSNFGKQFQTSFDIKKLKELGLASTYYPHTFNIHPRIKKYHIEQRLKSFQKNNLNWATCQALAFFSLISQGYNIRMTGQDVERGTFSQRHLNLIDQKNEQQFNPLSFFAQQNINKPIVQIFNSPLSQNGVMSYQYGYSLDSPNNLVIWQAQFGDFFNPAQVVVDTFLVNSQAKWLRQTGLVLLLPHGYDGAGPEHSSCRLQRFLQLANTDGINKKYKYKQFNQKSSKLKLGQQYFYQNIEYSNFSLAYPSKPSNYFHLLRRQMKRNFRKPLVIAGPKTLLRNSKCISKFQQMGEGSKFQKIIFYTNQNNKQNWKSLFICSGKFVYDIQDLINESKSTTTGLITIQQLYPFPQKQLKSVILQLPNQIRIYWIQEQNLNSGAFTFVEPHISRILQQCNKQDLVYVGRRSLATTAVGSGELHSEQSRQLKDLIKKYI